MKNWKNVKLGDILKPSKKVIELDPEQIYKQITIRMNHKGIILRGLIQGSQVGSKQYIANENQFIVSKIDARNGAYGIVPKELQDAIVTGDFLLFNTENNVDIDFLNYFSNTSYFDFECKKASEGTTNRVRLKVDKFLKIEIPLPPLAEQQRIAARLSALKNKIDEVKILRGEQIKAISEMMLDMLDIFFEHGEECSINDVCEKPQYGYTASADFNNIGVRLVRITDIQNGQVKWSNVPYCQCDRPETYLLKENDILFARTGGTIGKSFLVKSVPEDAVFASYLIRLRVKENVLPEYLYNFFQTRAYWRQITDTKTGTGQPNVNGVKLAYLKLKIPDLTTQEQIIDNIQAAKAKFEILKQHQAEQMTLLNGIFPSLLNKAFRGEL